MQVFLVPLPSTHTQIQQCKKLELMFRPLIWNLVSLPLSEGGRFQICDFQLWMLKLWAEMKLLSPTSAVPSSCPQCPQVPQGPWCHFLSFRAHCCPPAQCKVCSHIINCLVFKHKANVENFFIYLKLLLLSTCIYLLCVC